MSQLTIPARAVAQGTTVVGPFATGAGLNRVHINLDLANLVGTIDVLLEVALDGVTFTEVAESGATMPAPVDRTGVAPTGMALIADLGTLFVGGVAEPILTTAQSKIRATITSSAAFTTGGGSLVAS